MALFVGVRDGHLFPITQTRGKRQPASPLAPLVSPKNKKSFGITSFPHGFEGFCFWLFPSHFRGHIDSVTVIV